MSRLRLVAGTPGKNFVFSFSGGIIKHVSSGLNIHPFTPKHNDKPPTSGSQLVLYGDGEDDERCHFELDEDGCLYNAAGDVYVHPDGGVANNGTYLIFYEGGAESRLEFRFKPLDE
jgi:hypothetical protein